MDNQAFQLVSDALRRIEGKLDTVTKDHDNRIDSLESSRDEQRGMAKIGMALYTFVSGGVAFIVTHYFK